MKIDRLEAFSDGVIAILITIMVLELHVPAGSDLQALIPLVPKFFAYILSFTILAIYWNNHHHLLRSAGHVTPRIMWANMFLLFWLSLIPFFTNWLGEKITALTPTVLYAGVLLAAAFSYNLLVQAIIAHHGRHSKFAQQIGKDKKGLVSLGLYILSIAFAFINTSVSDVLFVAVALMWFVPDRRLEPVLSGEHED